MCQRQAAFRHHLHQVSQAQLEAEIPAHAQDDDLAVEVATLKQLLNAHQLAHAHPSGRSADIIPGPILLFAPEPSNLARPNKPVPKPRTKTRRYPREPLPPAIVANGLGHAIDAAK